MNKMREYERGREDGLDLARRIVREMLMVQELQKKKLRMDY